MFVVKLLNHEHLKTFSDQLSHHMAFTHGTGPPDLLSAVVAASTIIDWQGHIRIVIVMTQSEAYGFGDDSMDEYASGRCPDQKWCTDLVQCFRVLAVEKHVDTVFCDTGKPSSTRKAIEKVCDGNVRQIRMAELFICFLCFRICSLWEDLEDWN